VLLESTLRNVDNFVVSEEDVVRLVKYNPAAPLQVEVPFKVARVILQDFTGVPCVVDLAAMRAAMKRAGGDPQKINPLVPVDLVIDHSVQVDEFGSSFALFNNVKTEFERNRERYEFLKWGQKAFRNFGVVPPATGIVHQVNLEYLAKVVYVKEGVRDARLARRHRLAHDDGQRPRRRRLGRRRDRGRGVHARPADLPRHARSRRLQTPRRAARRRDRDRPSADDHADPAVVRRGGKISSSSTARLGNMTVADRATIANMAPEYGATIGFFPVDEQTLTYMRLTGRSAGQVDLVERYSKEQGLWRNDKVEPTFTKVLELDLATVVPSLAGPKRPQDRVELPGVRKAFASAVADAHKSTKKSVRRRRPGSLAGQRGRRRGRRRVGPEERRRRHRAITSCTNTSNPDVMIAAGLLAKKAVEKGLTQKPWVKTSLSPGSRVVTDYFEKAGLQTYLDKVGFQTTGYGCMTCIGNSGPLPEHVAAEVEANDLVVSAVLSGNRNFEGRINPHVKANFLASPPLVVAYALAGTVDIDLLSSRSARTRRVSPSS
jgi:aconitate hydratase